jgi:hypothetical protein
MIRRLNERSLLPEGFSKVRGVAQVHPEAEEREDLDEAIEGAVDEAPVGRGHLAGTGDPPVEDVRDAAERYREAAPLQPAEAGFRRSGSLAREGLGARLPRARSVFP